MSGGGGNTTTVQQADPWEGAQPFLRDIMGQGQALYRSNVGDRYFPGSTVVPFAPESEIALGALTNRALAGSPVTPAAQGMLTDTLRGDYLDVTQNPQYGVLAEDITNRVNTQFGAAGRTGSPAHQEAIARGISEGAAPLYDAERQRQMQGLLTAPTIEGLDIADAQRMAQVGAAREGKVGETIQDQMDRYFYEQEAPWRNLGNYANIVSGFGGLGGTTTSTGPGRPRGGLGGAIGGAAAGAGIASALGPGGLGVLSAGSPWAWPLIGLGALGGFF